MPTQSLVIPAVGPLYDRLGRFADPALRVAAGIFLMPHGAQKLFGWFGGYGLEATAQYFQEQMGFSNGTLAALGAGSVEFFGGLFLALGLLTRLSAGTIAVLLAVALAFHLPNGFFWTSGGYEYPLLWLILAVAYIVKGGGAYSLDRLIGREI